MHDGCTFLKKGLSTATVVLYYQKSLQKALFPMQIYFVPI